MRYQTLGLLTTKALSLFFMSFGGIDASEVLVNTRDGRTLVLDVDPDICLDVLQEHVATLTEDGAFLIAIPPKKMEREEFVFQTGTQGSYLGHPREYFPALNKTEQNDIRYILTSLADKSLITIAFIKSDLEAAGDRIDHLHPLRFLMEIFADEELKVAIRNIRGRGWIWHHFAGGIKTCLATEANIGNMRDEYVRHFAQTLNMPVDRVATPIHQKNWDKLIDILIKDIPRTGDHDRYGN